jgi:hypothetical protein
MRSLAGLAEAMSASPGGLTLRVSRGGVPVEIRIRAGA